MVLNKTCELCGATYWDWFHNGKNIEEVGFVCNKCIGVISAPGWEPEVDDEDVDVDECDITPEEQTEWQLVNHPSHYCREGQQCEQIECLDAIEASMSPEEFKGYLKGNALKYIWRYDLKGTPERDLRKAIFYLERLADYVEVEEMAKNDD